MKNTQNQEIRKRICGSLNGWEYWALFEGGVMISPWMCTREGALMFQSQYNKGVPAESICVINNIDYVHKKFSGFQFDHEKEENMYHSKDAKLNAAKLID